MENPMMAPRPIHSTKKKYGLMIFAIIFMMGLAGFSYAFYSDHPLLIVLAADDAEAWNITIHIKETSGINGNTIIIGTASNASDSLDQYDLPEPPFPPQFPYLRCWLETSFSVPFNSLLQEYKSSSTDNKVWNLSILWMQIPGNQSTTIIEISWDLIEIKSADLNSLLLYQNNTVVADLLTINSYSFSSNGSIHHFKIVGQNVQKNNSSEQNDLPILSITLGIIILVIVAIIALFVYKQKK
jgi:hypothetical protein